jgi:hypothetical protein
MGQIDGVANDIGLFQKVGRDIDGRIGDQQRGRMAERPSGRRG